MVVTSEVLGMFERLAQGRYFAVWWLGVEAVTCWLQVYCPYTLHRQTDRQT